MDINTGMIAAGLAVGILVGLTGMGAGSLMTPILITVFGIPPSTAVGSDLIYAAITKCFGAARHHQLKNVNKELAYWMAAGSVPAAILGVFTLYEILPRIGMNPDTVLLNLIGIILVIVGITVAARTFITIPGLWDADKLPTDGPLTYRHKVMAVMIGVVFGFILGLTSVGSGVFFGLALVTLFPLAARRVVGTDLFHAMMVTVAAGLATMRLGRAQLQRGRLDPDRLDPRHPDRLALHRPRPRARCCAASSPLVLAASGLKTLDATLMAT